MKSVSGQGQRTGGLFFAMACAIIAGCGTAAAGRQQHGGKVATSEVNVVTPAGVSRPPFTFSDDDAAFLDQVQRGSFQFLWNACDPRTGMVVDRSSVRVVSVAGIGFQLSALPIGVERGWVTREQAEQRALLIVRKLEANPTNRKAGLFFHYVDGADAGASTQGYEVVVSTIDSAILFAGLLTASSYFGGEVAAIADRLFENADWSFFLSAADEPKPFERGWISLAWKPDDKKNPTGPGSLAPFYWIDAGDEQRLVAFLAACAPNDQHRVHPNVYYRLRRMMGEHAATGPMSFFPWSGALFTNFFAHCWINYAAAGPDNPKARGIDHRPSIDWWENARRAVALHRAKRSQSPHAHVRASEHMWGMTAMDAKDGYRVPGLFPARIDVPGWVPDNDYVSAAPKDDHGDGTIAPYGPGCSIMFEPEASVAALRHFASLTAPDGKPLVWRDPASGGYGFFDSFNLGTGWVAPDHVAIDQGPLILAIENARTGRVWRWFGQHRWVREGSARLGISLGVSP
jgi:hypothetical protein